MEWIDGNIGSKLTMKYPCCVLKGDNSKGTCVTISLASSNQDQDTGARMIHLGKILRVISFLRVLLEMVEMLLIAEKLELEKMLLTLML